MIREGDYHYSNGTRTVYYEDYSNTHIFIELYHSYRTRYATNTYLY